MTIKVEALVDGGYVPEEAAKPLGKEIATIWRWIREDKVMAVRMGRRTLIPGQEVERLKKQDLPQPQNG